MIDFEIYEYIIFLYSYKLVGMKRKILLFIYLYSSDFLIFLMLREFFLVEFFMLW